MTDVLDRLALADPVDADALVLPPLASLVERRRRLPVRRVLVAAAAAVAAIGLAFVARGGSPDPAARAYAMAALPRGGILHADWTMTTVRGGRVTDREHTELWAADDGRFHLLHTYRGRLSESAGSPRGRVRLVDGVVRHLPALTSAQARYGVQAITPGALFVHLYRHGALRSTGAETVDGRAGVRFSLQDGGAQIDYVVDPHESYRPLLVRVTGRGLRTGATRWVTTSRIASYEHLPDTPGNRHLLELRTGAKSRRER